MNKHLCLIGMAVVYGAISAIAQTKPTKEEPPSPPYIATVPPPASWTIRPATPPTPNPQVSTLKEIRVAKTRDMKQEISLWSNGTESESWYVDTFVIYRQPHFVKDDVAILEQRPDSTTNFFSTGDFSNLGWIGKDTFQRTETHKGKLCHYYENGNSADFEKIPEPIRSQRQFATPKAWIDAKTRLPVAIEQGGILQEYSYTFGSPQSLTLPPLFSARLEKLLARRKAASK